MLNIFDEVISWSRKEFSDLLWRVERTPYSTLVSEIMLQQTTVSTVLKHYHRFLEKFPDIQTLASASEDEVVLNWQGLGYYRRARNLHGAAKEIVDKFSGEIPNSYEELIQIKGIGDYTASAILSLCFGRDFLAMDANVERVLSRFYRSPEVKGIKNIRFLKKHFSTQSYAKSLNYGLFNEALMDIGRNYCRARNTTCLLCPLSEECLSSGREDALNFPKQVEKKQMKYLDLKILRVVKKENEKVLFFKRPKGYWLEGQYELPSFILSSEDKNLKQYPMSKKISYKNLKKVKTSITKYRIENYVFHDEMSEFHFKTEGIWASKAELDRYHISVASKKSLGW